MSHYLRTRRLCRLTHFDSSKWTPSPTLLHICKLCRLICLCINVCPIIDPDYFDTASTQVHARQIIQRRVAVQRMFTTCTLCLLVHQERNAKDVGAAWSFLACSLFLQVTAGANCIILRTYMPSRHQDLKPFFQGSASTDDCYSPPTHILHI